VAGESGAAITLAARVRRRADVVTRELGGELVLLNLATGVYFGLDAVGTRMWTVLGETPTLADALPVLLAEYDVAPARCERDLVSLVAALGEHRLLDVLGGPAA